MVSSDTTHISDTPTQEPVSAPGRCELPLDGRGDAEAVSGSNTFISWGARSGRGIVREHNGGLVPFAHSPFSPSVMVWEVTPLVR